MIASLKLWLAAHQYNFLTGILFGIGGYFASVYNIGAVLLGAVLIDLITGIWASRVQGKGIKSKKLKISVYKLALYYLIVGLVFCIDKEMGMIQIHKAMAWAICGFEVWSILENGAKITNHRVFRILKRYMEDRVKDNIGVELNEDKRG